MTPRSSTRPTSRRPSAQRPGRIRLRRILVPVLFLAVAAFLYARPLSNYSETKADLAERERSVVALRRQKTELSRQLDRTTNLEALARQARGIGYVKPGEQLFIVKGIPAWRRGLGAGQPLAK